MSVDIFLVATLLFASNVAFLLTHDASFVTTAIVLPASFSFGLLAFVYEKERRRKIKNLNNDNLLLKNEIQRLNSLLSIKNDERIVFHEDVQQVSDDSENVVLEVLHVSKFLATPSFETALALIQNGAGTFENTLEVVPTLQKILTTQKLADADFIAHKALESNSFDDFLKVDQDIDTPNVQRAKKRFKLMELEKKLLHAIKTEDEHQLISLLDDAMKLDYQSLEVLDETIVLAQNTLRKISTDIEALLKIVNLEDDPTQLISALSTELWSWQALLTIDNLISLHRQVMRLADARLLS